MSEALALKLFNNAFYAQEDPRSYEFQQGAMAALRNRLNDAVIICHYAVGTAQFDAWVAGLAEGHDIFQCWKAWDAAGYQTQGE